MMGASAGGTSSLLAAHCGDAARGGVVPGLGSPALSKVSFKVLSLEGGVGD